MGLFYGVTGRVRAARARAIVDLADLQRICRPARAWVTPDEWVSVWQRGRRWNGSWEVARRAVFRLQVLLRELVGAALWVETPQARGGMRVYVDTPELARLVDRELLEARRIDERVSAGREEREHEEVAAPVSVDDAIARARSASRPSVRLLSRRYGIRREKLARVLRAAGHPVHGRPGRPLIEDRRSPDLIARALRAHDEGADVDELRRLLICGRATVYRLLERQGRRARSE